MTAATVMVAVPTGLAAAVAATWALLWWRSYRRDPGTPQTREWTAEELRHMPPGWVPPTGRHRHVAAQAAAQIGGNPHYEGAHSEDRLNRAIAVVVLSVRSVTFRARALAWTLGWRTCHPGCESEERTRMVLLALTLRLKHCGCRDGLASTLRYGPSKAVRSC